MRIPKSFRSPTHYVKVIDGMMVFKQSDWPVNTFEDEDGYLRNCRTARVKLYNWSIMAYRATRWDFLSRFAHYVIR